MVNSWHQLSSFAYKEQGGHSAKRQVASIMWQALPDAGGISKGVIDVITLGESVIKHEQGGLGQEMKHSDESNWLMLMGTNAWSGTGEI